MTTVTARSLLSIAAITTLAAVAEPARAQNSCAAGKVKAAAQRAVCRALLEAGEAASNKPAKTTAIAKCASAFASSFAKAEDGGGCFTTGDTETVGARADDFVTALATALDVGTPAEPSKCEAGKVRAAAKKASCLLKLIAQRTAKPLAPPSGAKLAKCESTFATAFAKLESKPGCHTTDDQAAIGALIDEFVYGADADLTPVLESGCAPVTPVALHGDDPFYGNTRITPIVNGKVPCLHVETLKKTSCAFRSDSGDWIETASGNYALLGQWVAKNGDPGGEYTVAATVNDDLTVPCIEPPANDVSGTGTADSLAHACTFEWFGSSRNESGVLLGNHATRSVCTTSIPHPDQTAQGPILVECLGEDVQACCYTGRGAGLNSAIGNERDENGFYLTGSSRCHVAISSGIEVYAAKRPATRVFPDAILPFSPLVWRPVSRLDIAN